jgi:hypothetical protein
MFVSVQEKGRGWMELLGCSTKAFSREEIGKKIPALWRGFGTMF